MKFTVVTLFPKVIEAFLSEGLVAQANKKGLFTCETLNPRKFTTDVHQTVDDRTFGGSDGMVLKYEPLAASIESLKSSAVAPTQVVVLTPQGKPWTQSQAKKWSESAGHVVLVCGRYAGIDQRFIHKYCDEEVSVGDYVLNGGELAACVVMESVARLLPGVLGNQVSAIKDSFTDGTLECPAFTRPREVDGMAVPAPLLTGNHAEMAKFERAVSLARTRKIRPDLWRAEWNHDWQQAVKILSECSPADLEILGLEPVDLNLKDFKNGI